MKIGRKLSNSLLRDEMFNRANKSLGTSTRTVIWRRSCPLIGFVLCSIGVPLALAGSSKSVAGNPAAAFPETQNTFFSLTTGTDNAAIDTSALPSNTTDNDKAPSARSAMGMARSG